MAPYKHLKTILQVKDQDFRVSIKALRKGFGKNGGKK